MFSFHDHSGLDPGFIFHVKLSYRVLVLLVLHLEFLWNVIRLGVWLSGSLLWNRRLLGKRAVLGLRVLLGKGDLLGWRGKRNILQKRGILGRDGLLGMGRCLI